jgi:hypothetical protein
MTDEIRTIPPPLTHIEWNALLDHSLEKPASYIIRKSGSTIQAINGSTGKIDFPGTDWTTVVQAAANALTSGGRIHIKNAPYTVTGQITISYDYVTVDGEGRGTILKLADGVNVDMAVFLITANHCSIKNLQIDGNKANQTAGEQHGVFIQGTTGTHILGNSVTDCYIHDFGRASGLGSSVKNDYHDHGEIVHNVCKNNNHWGIAIWNDCDYLLIADNRINNCYEGIEIHGYSWGNMVIGNISVYCSKHGIIDDGGNLTAIIGNFLYHNGNGASYDGRGGCGIRVNGEALVIGNTVRWSGESGIAATSAGSKAYIVGNFVDSSSQNATNTWGNIEVLYSAANCYVADNTCRIGPSTPHPAYGIRVKSDAGTGNCIEDNDVLSSGDTATILCDVACIDKGNRGHNPTGYISPDPTWGASPWTYTAGNTPEDVYVSGGTLSSIAKGGQTLGITSGLIHLEPGESIAITYSAAGTVKRFGV